MVRQLTDGARTNVVRERNAKYINRISNEKDRKMQSINAAKLQDSDIDRVEDSVGQKIDVISEVKRGENFLPSLLLPPNHFQEP